LTQIVSVKCENSEKHNAFDDDKMNVLYSWTSQNRSVKLKAGFYLSSNNVKPLLGT